MTAVRFYVGLHQPSDAAHFERACISVNRLRKRKSGVPTGGHWMMDSGAFTELDQHGRYRHTPAVYATEINRHARMNPGLRIAVSQDYMCEPHILSRTGLDVASHQRLTIERYDQLHPLVMIPVMPVIQGYQPAEYANHTYQYGNRLTPGAWVGVGSVCKRQGDATAIVDVLTAIHNVRPDLRIHGFGVKRTALLHPGVRELLWSADSMAWSFAARKEGRNANDWREAERFVISITNAQTVGSTWQPRMFT